MWAAIIGGVFVVAGFEAEKSVDVNTKNGEMGLCSFRMPESWPEEVQTLCQLPAQQTSFLAMIIICCTIITLHISENSYASRYFLRHIPSGT